MQTLQRDQTLGVENFTAEQECDFCCLMGEMNTTTVFSTVVVFLKGGESI